MKQCSWLLGCISLLLVVSACVPLAPPNIEVIDAASPAAVQPAPTVSDAPESEDTEVEAEGAEAEVEVEPEPEPAAPTMTSPQPGAELNSQLLEFAGIGEPGGTVQVLIDGTVSGATEVDSDGNWSLEVSLTESEEYDIILQLLDPAGTVLAETEPFSVSASFELAPETPIAEDTATAEVEGESVSPSITYPAADFELNGRVLEIAGTGEPGSQLQVLIDGEVVDTVAVRSGGRWYLADQGEALPVKHWCG